MIWLYFLMHVLVLIDLNASENVSLRLQFNSFKVINNKFITTTLPYKNSQCAAVSVSRGVLYCKCVYVNIQYAF